MRITPINVAEAIIEPFWDAELSGIAKWTIHPGETHGLRVAQFWCWVAFEWRRKPDIGPAFSMHRQIDVDCSGYDRLMLSINAPKGSRVGITAITDKGTVAYRSDPSPNIRKEHLVDLQGANMISDVTIEILDVDDGVSAGWLNWLGLQNTTLLPVYLAQWDCFDAQWEHHLKPESYEPSFQPSYGFVISDEELERLRAEQGSALLDGSSPYAIAARNAQHLVPERMICDFEGRGGDVRYAREREFGHELTSMHGYHAALAGLLLKDKRLLRLAARFAMSLAMCGRWHDGMICHFPGSNFHHACFDAAECAEQLGMALDLAGEMFTETGRNYILRRIAEEGMGIINYNTWRHDYIFHCNQLVLFTKGRMLGYAVLERLWPRVTPYTEIAYRELIETLENVIVHDGGFVEGPTYLQAIAWRAGNSLYYYARARGLTMDHVTPEPLRKTARYAEIVASTDDDMEYIPLCDGNRNMEPHLLDPLAVMAALLPDSHWVNMYRKAERLSGEPSTSLLVRMLDNAIPRSGPDFKPFVHLQATGLMSSVRRVRDELLKLVLIGGGPGAEHAHEDKGSFVVEYAGDTFAADPGSASYAGIYAGIMMGCEYHNMLIPVGIPHRPAPTNPPNIDVKPSGQGNDISFHAQIDAAPGWEGYYRKWIRTWDSPGPETLIISDDYELEQGDGVEFCWVTRLPVTVSGDIATIHGRRGKMMVQAPTGCTVRLETLSLGDDSIQQIAICHEGTSGKLVIRVTIASGDDDIPASECSVTTGGHL